MNNKFSEIIIKLLPFIELNGDIKCDDLSVVDELLDYTFPAGKYKGKKFESVIAYEDNFNYCLWWAKQNVNQEQLIRLYPFLLKLSFIAHDRINQRLWKKESEYESRRFKWCEKNNVDYDLDYAIRHNPAMRDFGM